MTTQITQYSHSSFSTQTLNGNQITHDVYQRGTGPVVVIIQELPGIGQATLRLADKFVDAGFCVVMPHLFGPLGKVSIAGNLARVFCLRKEFSLFSKKRSSPIVDWLRALCQSIRAENNVSGVGVIGMCLTGNFAISLMADDSVLAAVAAQPAMPFGSPESLHMSTDDLAAIKRNIDRTLPIKAYRFSGDWMCQKSKFDALGAALNTDANRIQLTTLPGNKHSVFTLDFVDSAGHPTHNALNEVLDYFSHALAKTPKNEKHH
jgi:dienelactone hydrolase